MMGAQASDGRSSKQRHADAVVVIGTALLAVALLLLGNSVKWPLDDFVEYWAAGSLTLAGGNPYDPAAMLVEQRSIGWTAPSAVMMYNPPWTLPLASLFSLMPFPVARSVWLPLQLLMVLWCAIRLWIMYGGEHRLALRAAGVALLWMPTIVALRMGQVSPLILLGLVGFLSSVSEKRDFAAGAFLSLTAVKPQLVALVWVAVMLAVIAERRWRMLAGMVVAFGGMSIATWLLHPDAFSQYAHLMTSARPTNAFESPNVATALRLAAGGSSDWPQYLPTALGAVFVALVWWRKREDWNWTQEFRWLVLLSCLATSYGGWPFDLVVLVIPIVAEAARLSRVGSTWALTAGTAAFASITAGALALHAAHVPQALFIWMAPSVAIALLALGRARQCAWAMSIPPGSVASAGANQRF